MQASTVTCENFITDKHINKKNKDSTTINIANKSINETKIISKKEINPTRTGYSTKLYLEWFKKFLEIWIPRIEKKIIHIF